MLFRLNSTAIAATIVIIQTASAAPPSRQYQPDVADFTPDALSGVSATLYSPHETPAPSAAPIEARAGLAEPPPLLTISVVNKLPGAISTVHVRNPGAPTAVSGNVAPGTMPAGATAAFAVPTGWAGNVQVGAAHFPVTGDMSLIEGSFLVQQGVSQFAVVDIDVSFV